MGITINKLMAFYERKNLFSFSFFLMFDNSICSREAKFSPSEWEQRRKNFFFLILNKEKEIRKGNGKVRGERERDIDNSNETINVFNRITSARNHHTVRKNGEMFIKTNQQAIKEALRASNCIQYKIYIFVAILMTWKMKIEVKWFPAALWLWMETTKNIFIFLQVARKQFVEMKKKWYEE